MSDYWFEEETLVTKFLWKTLLRVIKIVLNHKSLLILFLASTVLMGVNVGIEIIIVKQLVDLGIIPGNSEMVGLYIILFGINWSGWIILAFCMIYCGTRLGNHLLDGLRKQIFEHIQDLLELSYGFLY